MLKLLDQILPPARLSNVKIQFKHLISCLVETVLFNDSLLANSKVKNPSSTLKPGQKHLIHTRHEETYIIENIYK